MTEPSRRGFLKSAAGVAGVAIGGGAVSGFPTIRAQNIKDITLRHAGPTVTAIPAIAAQATKDVGFTVQMQTAENADLPNRLLSQSNAMDCADIGMVWLKYLPGRGILQTIPVSKFKYRDQTLPMFIKGRYADGREGSKQGVAPYTILYAASSDGGKISLEPTEWVKGVGGIVCQHCPHAGCAGQVAGGRGCHADVR